MQREIRKTTRTGALFSLYLKCTALFILILSIGLLLAACGNQNTTRADASNATQKPKATIQLGSKSSPTPPQAPYACGEWVTNATPAYNPAGNIPIYGKFTKNVNGNPQGVVGATATFTISWGDGYVETQTTNTLTDGLAVVYARMDNHREAINKLSLIAVSFQSTDGQKCERDAQSASFVLLKAGAPANPTPTKGGKPTKTAMPGMTPDPSGGTQTDPGATPTP